MIEAYAVGVVAKLEDQVTPGMLRIIESLERASKLALDFAGSLRAISLSGKSLAGNLDKAVIAAGKFGDSPGLVAASARLDTMAVASADIARNLEAARVAGASTGGPIGRSPSGSGSSGGSGGSSHRTTIGSDSLAISGIAALGGVYENARLDDTNVKAIATSQIPFDEWEKTMAMLRKKEFEYASRYAFASGGRIEPFGEAILGSSRLLRTMPQGKQEQMLDTAMPYAAIEAKLKDVPLPEALEAFIGLAHQAGAYSEQEAKPLFGAMVQASLTTHSSLGEIARAASYALPALHAAGANSADVMLMIATMQQAGIMNTKSGTWINAMAMNALPNTLGSGLFKNENQNKALHELGLYRGNTAQFYRNGQFDLMKEVSILADAREKMGAIKFNAASRMAFGMQGQRAADIFSEQSTLDNLHALQSLKNQEQNPESVEAMIGRLSTVAKMDQTIANANMTLMNATATFMAPVNAVLDKSSGFFKTAAPAAEEHPMLAAGGIVGAAFTGTVVWKLVSKMFGGGANMLVSAITGGLGRFLGVAITGAAGAIASAGGLLTILGVGLAATLGGAIGVGIGWIFNQAVEFAVKKITGKDGTVGTLFYDFNAWVTGQGRSSDLTAIGQKAFEEAERLKKLKLPPAPPTPRGPTAAAAEAQNSAAGQPIINMNPQFFIDSKEITAHMIPNTTFGTTGMNPSASILRPGLGSMGIP